MKEFSVLFIRDYVQPFVPHRVVLLFSKYSMMPCCSIAWCKVLCLLNVAAHRVICWSFVLSIQYGHMLLLIPSSVDIWCFEKKELCSKWLEVVIGSGQSMLSGSVYTNLEKHGISGLRDDLIVLHARACWSSSEAHESRQWQRTWMNQSSKFRFRLTR